MLFRSGSYNVAVGTSALQANTTASNNTAVGYKAAYNVNGSNYSVFVGSRTASSGASVITGDYHTCVGDASGFVLQGTSTNNAFFGQSSGAYVTTGSKNTIIGSYNGNQGGLDIRTADNYIVLSDGDGNPRMYMNGSTFWSPATVSYTTGGSANLRIFAAGDIGTSTSSLRYKRNIQNAPYGLSDVMNLRPVIYQSKSPQDGDLVFGGFIAEEVHDAGLTQFVDYDEEGRPNALQYGNMVSLMAKAIQELKSELDSVKAELATLKIVRAHV